MTSPNASPQKPSERTPQKGGAASRGGTPAKTSAAATPQKSAPPAATAPAPSPARSAPKWQWQETAVPASTSRPFAWTRLWRFSSLLLQANC